MFHSGHRPPWIRRTVWLTASLALLLLAGSIAVFESLVDDSESEQSSPGQSEDTDELSSEDAKNYLYRFGYISAPQAEQQPADADADQLLLQAQPVATSGRRTAEELLKDTSLDLLKSAIRRFQKFAGLPPTGELDNRTKKKMKQPRCGMQDVEKLKIRGGKEMSKWRKRQLTYHVDYFTADLPIYMQEKALQMAFDLWSRYVPLDFSESSDGQADIRIRFRRGGHGDPWPFDGRGGVLAHALYPPLGQLHFDNDEYWAFNDSAKILSDGFIDLFWVSLHEIGHVIGVHHSVVESAIMAPIYGDPEDMVDRRGNYKLPELTTDDIRAAQQIYGSRRTGSNRRTGFVHNTGSAGRRTGQNDDSKSDFLSKLGILSGENDVGDGVTGTADANTPGHGRDLIRGSELRRHRNEAEEEEEDGGSFASNRSPVQNPSYFLLMLFTFLAAIYAA